MWDYMEMMFKFQVENCSIIIALYSSPALLLNPTESQHLPRSLTALSPPLITGKRRFVVVYNGIEHHQSGDQIWSTAARWCESGITDWGWVTGHCTGGSERVYVKKDQYALTVNWIFYSPTVPSAQIAITFFTRTSLCVSNKTQAGLSLSALHLWRTPPHASHLTISTLQDKSPVNVWGEMSPLCCDICFEQFNSSSRRPLVICHNGHSVCKLCFKNMRTCPQCRWGEAGDILLLFSHFTGQTASRNQFQIFLCWKHSVR